MPALATTEHVATITWLGLVSPDIAGDRVNSGAVDRIELDFGGAIGDLHHGLTRPACVRVKHMHAKDTEIGNARQLSIVSQEEIDAIAAEIGLEGFNPEWLGATMVVSGIPDFTHVPPSSRLQAKNGATLVIDMENRPCVWPGREIDREHKGLGPKFKTAAENRRGVTAWVERPGNLVVGDRLKLYAPAQRSWAP